MRPSPARPASSIRVQPRRSRIAWISAPTRIRCSTVRRAASSASWERLTPGMIAACSFLALHPHLRVRGTAGGIAPRPFHAGMNTRRSARPIAATSRGACGSFWPRYVRNEHVPCTARLSRVAGSRVAADGEPGRGRGTSQGPGRGRTGPGAASGPAAAPDDVTRSRLAPRATPGSSSRRRLPRRRPWSGATGAGPSGSSPR